MATSMIVTLVLIGVGALILVLTIWGLLSRYRRAAPDELLVVFGKNKKITVDQDYFDDKGNKQTKKVTVNLPSKIIHGGGSFVWPIVQDWKKMSMKPIQIESDIVGPDSGMIQTRVKVVLTTAISTESSIQQNAAVRFLSASQKDIEDQIKAMFDGIVRLIIASMTIEELNSDRNAFNKKINENLVDELMKVGYEVTNINIQDISDNADYLKNLGKKKETEARANAEADIADKMKDGAIRKANIQKEQDTQVATADKERETTVAQTKQEQEVKVAEINREKQIKLAEAEKDRESGVAVQNAAKEAAIAEAEADAESNKAKAKARQVAAVAEAQKNAESQKAEFEAEQTKNIAKAEADAEATENEQEALKQTRIAKANQEKEAEIVKATQEKESKAAEYESEKRKRKAEADKKAGVAEQMSKIEVAQATAKAGQAEADAKKIKETAMVDAEMTVAKTKQEKQLEVNKAQAKAAEELLNATEIVPAQKAKEKIVIEAQATKEKAELEAEALKVKIIKEAEAQAEKILKTKEAEAEGERKILLAQAEGKRASLMAEAEKIQAIEMAPALAAEKMKEAGLTPELMVQFKTIDIMPAVADAQAKMFEHIQLGNVTVYGNENTAGNFMAGLAKNLNPAMDILRSLPINETVKKVIGGGKTETPDNPEKKDEDFTEVDKPEDKTNKGKDKK